MNRETNVSSIAVPYRTEQPGTNFTGRDIAASVTTVLPASNNADGDSESRNPVPGQIDEHLATSQNSSVSILNRPLEARDDTTGANANGLAKASNQTLQKEHQVQKHGQPQKFSIWTDWWFWEVLAGIISVSSVISIFGILLAYRNKKVPDLYHGITLNALISVLATLAQTSLIMVVSAAISQNKWIWYRRKSRTVQDLEVFENASRGPVGALIMLCTHRTWSLASLGALLTVVALAMGPFVQQVLTFPLRTVLTDSDAAITSFSRSFGDYGDSDPSYIDIRAALNTGLTSGNVLAKPLCPSGSCTWPLFRSTAWCSRCTDVKDIIESEGCRLDWNATYAGLPNPPNQVHRCTLSIPGGLSTTVPWVVEYEPAYQLNQTWYLRARLPEIVVWSVNNREDDDFSFDMLNIINSTSDGLLNPAITFGYVSLNYTTVFSKMETSTALQRRRLIEKAYTCSLTPCVNTYNISVVNGTTQQEVVHTDFGSAVYIGIANAAISGGPPPRNAPRQSKSEFNMAALDHWYSTELDQGRVTDSAWLFELEDYPYWNMTDEFANFTYRVNPIKAPAPYNPDDTDGIGIGMNEVASVGGVREIYNLLSGSTTVVHVFSNETTGPTDFQPIGFTQQTNYSSDAMGPISQTPNFPQLMSNIADRLTLLFQESSNLTHTGSVARSESYVEVHWAWLSLPAAEVVLGIIFLAFVMVETKRAKMHIWKTSTLAMIYHGYDGDLQDLRHAELNSAMAKHAKKLRVRFKRDEASGSLGLGQEPVV